MKVCRLHFTVFVNDLGFEMNGADVFIIPMQFCHYAQKENQMPSPSNHFTQCPLVDRILQPKQKLQIGEETLVDANPCKEGSIKTRRVDQ